MEFSENIIVWYTSFKYNTDKQSHLELPKTVKASLIKRKAKFTLCSLPFKNLKSVMILFKSKFFPAISIMGKEYGYVLQNTYVYQPLHFSSIIGLTSSFTCPVNLLQYLESTFFISKAECFSIFDQKGVNFFLFFC